MGKQSCRLPFDLAVFAGFCRMRPQIIPKGQMPAQFQRIRRTDIQVMRHEIRLVLIGERLPLRDAEIPFVEVFQQCQFLFDLRKKSGLFQNQIQIKDRIWPKALLPRCSPHVQPLKAKFVGAPKVVLLFVQMPLSMPGHTAARLRFGPHFTTPFMRGDSMNRQRPFLCAGWGDFEKRKTAFSFGQADVPIAFCQHTCAGSCLQKAA